VDNQGKYFSILKIILYSLGILYLIILTKQFFIGFYHFFLNITLPFIIAMVISYLLHPIVKVLHKKRVPLSIAVILIYTIFFGTLTIILINIIPEIIKQGKDFLSYLPDMYRDLQYWIDRIRYDHTYFLPDSVRDGIDQVLLQGEKLITQWINSLFKQFNQTFNILFLIFLIPFLTYYMLKDFQHFEKITLRFIPKKYRNDIIVLFKEIDEALGEYIRGQLIVSLILGGLAYISYLFIGLPYPLLLALVITVTNVIPYLGPILGAIPALIIAFTISWKTLVITLIINFVIQNLEGNWISPQIMSKTLDIHPLTIIFVLLIGEEVLGLVGLIFSVPIYIIIRVIVHYIALRFIKYS